jgi:hypothetical protein
MVNEFDKYFLINSILTDQPVSKVFSYVAPKPEG